MLINSELTVNQGSNLKLKLGDQRYNHLSRLEFLRNLTVGKPLYLDIVESIWIQMSFPKQKSIIHRIRRQVLFQYIASVYTWLVWGYAELKVNPSTEFTQMNGVV